MKNKCLNCREYKNCKDSYASWFFFIVGLVATVSIRAVTILTRLDSVYGKIAWYIGVGGFFIFFIYKFRVNQNRSRVILQGKLLDRINQKDKLTEEDYSVISTILCALSSKKERINYIFIFALSAVAIILAVYMDFIS